MSIFFDRESAQKLSRRQLRGSVLMVAVMATAAFVIGFATPINSARKATPTPPNDAFTGRLVGDKIIGTDARRSAELLLSSGDCGLDQRGIGVADTRPIDPRQDDPLP